MRIAINALFLRTKVAGGTETYVTNVVRPWYEGGRTDLCFELYANHIPCWWRGNREGFRLRLVPGAVSLARRIAYEQAVLALRSPGWDVLFNPGYVGVLGARCPQVVTVHDAYAWVLPKEAGVLRAAYWRWMIARSVRSSAAVIAVSESTRRDLLRFTQAQPERVRVIHEAGDHIPESARPPGEVASGAPFFLAIGIFKEVKNPERALAAYSEYRRRRAGRGLPVCGLKLVGVVRGAQAERIRAMAEATEGVEFLGRVEDDRLRQLLETAAGFLFPSLYEGFGIPILEAQRAGCPVLTSTTSSMPEIAGDGAILVEPLDTGSIAEGLEKLGDPGIRETMIARGRLNAARFSWARASESTLTLLLSHVRVSKGGARQR